MASGVLSPRQKMINMMYLVLTALLALNVSKEVLNSFFEVNKGIERTTTNFNLKNGETYDTFDNAAGNNPEKYQEVRNKAYEVKKIADEVTMYIQEMKYDLVSRCDKGEVYLGTAIDILDEDGKLIPEKAQVDKKFKELTLQQKYLPIGWLNNKSDRDGAGDLFFPKTSAGKNKRATILKNKIEEYRLLLIQNANDDASLIANINLVCDISNKGSGKKLQTWEEYNFVDMPSVGALTILSKVQSDLRNIEADLINYLKRDIDSKSLKFTSAEGIQIPTTNFVLRGDSFRAEIFITAKNENQNPDIYVGEYDSLGVGKYEMKGVEGVDYETLQVINGKGMFATRTTSEGSKKWGGLIAMKTETGTKFYPFAGEYLVAAKTAVVSPTKMNILYTGLEAIGGNPIQISVPGYTAGEITPVMINGSLKPDKKSEGKYNAFPKSGMNEAIVVLYANVDGKRNKMGEVKFRVRKTPPPSPQVPAVDANGVCDRSILKTSVVIAKLDAFEFDGLKYAVTSFKLSGTYKGAPANDEQQNGMGFTTKMQGIIANAKSGSTINITKIRAKLIGANLPSEKVKGDLVIEIK
ncbi:MAG: type IX secretion system motor protein PorM/GldM [Flavobacteriales bacterium]